MQHLENFSSTWVGLCYSVLVVVVFLSTEAKQKCYDYLGGIAVALFTITFVGFRDRYSGTDTNSYVDYFEIASRSLSDAMEYEPGFAFFAHLIGQVGGWQTFLLLVIVIQLAAVAVACRLLVGVGVSLPLLIYVSLLPGLDMLANGLRQGLAVCLAVLIWALAWHCGVMSRVWLLIPVVFHKAMLVLVPFIFLRKDRHRWILVLAGVLLTAYLVLFAYAAFVVEDVLEAVGPLVESLSFEFVGTGLTFGEKLMGYINPESEIISPTLALYFALIPVAAALVGLRVYLVQSFSREAFASFRSLWALFSMSIVPYVFLIFTPYSYRFMYVAYLPAIMILSLAHAQLKTVHARALSVLIIYALGIATYGSTTFHGFRYSVM